MTATDGGSATGGDGRGGPGGDTVAAVVRQWRAVHPDLDTGPMEIIGRINRCAALLQQAEDAPLRRAGLSRAEFDLLGALRRTGHELTPGDLARETFSSGAAVTKRLKQLTERGLVERRGDTRDRRVAHVRLTDTGRDLVDGILPEQLAYEAAVLSGVDEPRQGSWRHFSAGCWASWRAAWTRCGSEAAPEGGAGPAPGGRHTPPRQAQRSSPARYTPNIAPRGSRSTAIRGPSGGETGSISTVPPPSVVPAAAVSTSVTAK